jgi:hypothetical protein
LTAADIDRPAMVPPSLPGLLLAMLNDGRWRDPDPDALRRLMPWFADPLHFLTSEDEMHKESQALIRIAENKRSSVALRCYRGSTSGDAVELPWLDADQAILIAVNHWPGDDVAISLDFRADPADPRVVASDTWTAPHQYVWRTVSERFSVFVRELGLD